MSEKKGVEGGTEKKKRGGGGQVSQGARGQLIVSGNVFHLHVYTVNSGRGLSTTPFTRCHSHTGWQFSQSKTPSTPDGFLFSHFSLVGRSREKCSAVHSC